MPVKEITLEELQTDGDWAQVFADENDGNVSKDLDACPPGSDVSMASFTRADVAEVIAAVNGENDRADWVGVFRLNDGRFLLASGGCDYTGWDCRASNSLEVAKDLDTLLAMGMNAEQRKRLGL